MLTLEYLLKVCNADCVAGDHIAIIEGKHTVIARRTADGDTVLTEAGILLANTLDPLDRDLSGDAGGSRPGRRGRKAKAGEQSVAGLDTQAAAALAALDDLSDDADDATHHTLDVEDDVEAELREG